MIKTREVKMNKCVLFLAGLFLQIVNKIAEIERELGIYDLSQFTPHIKDGY